MRKLIRLVLVAALFTGVMVGIGNSEASAHASSPEASTACNAYHPPSIASDAVVLHAHRLADIPGLGRNYQCERWNFKSGSASHGGFYKVLWLFSCNCPFGPFDVISY